MKTLFLTTISDTIKNKKKLSVVFKANIQIYCKVVPIETVFLKIIGAPEFPCQFHLTFFPCQNLFSLSEPAFRSLSI